MAKKRKPYNISEVGRAKRSEMGTKNLAAFKKAHPDQGKTQHGAYSKNIRLKYW